MEQSINVIEAKHLRKCYGSVVAVNNISFDVQRGEVFGLFGPDGAGKTSLLRLVTGFASLTEGDLKIFGQEPAGAWRSIRARTGVLLQENTLENELSVRENVESFGPFFGLSTAVARKRTTDLMELLGLASHAKARTGALAGELKRRVALARALLNEPELLIIDESSAGLDTASSRELWQQIARLRQVGITIVLATRDAEEAALLCDRLMVMDRGFGAALGCPGDLIRKHVDGRVIECAPVCDELRRWVDLTQHPHRETNGAMWIYCRDDATRCASILRQHPACTLAVRSGTLDDVFLALTGRGVQR